jgi:hypothetical protein
MRARLSPCPSKASTSKIPESVSAGERGAQRLGELAELDALAVRDSPTAARAIVRPFAKRTSAVRPTQKRAARP